MRVSCARQGAALHQKERPITKEVDGLLSKSTKSANGEVAALVSALALLDKRSQTWNTWAVERNVRRLACVRLPRVLESEHPEMRAVRGPH